MASSKIFKASNILNKKGSTLGDVAQSGVDPRTGEYLTTEQRKALFRKRSVSAEKVFGKPSAIVKFTASSIKPFVKEEKDQKGGALTKTFAVTSLVERIAVLEVQVSVLSSLIKKETEFEEKENKEIVRRERVEEEKKRRKSKSNQLVKKLKDALLTPVKMVAGKAQGILSTLMEVFTLLFFGWLTDKGLKAIQLNSQGNIKALEDLGKEVLKSLGAVAGIFLALNGGLFLVLSGLKSLTKRIAKFAWRQTFGRLFGGGAGAAAAGAAAGAAGGKPPTPGGAPGSAPGSVPGGKKGGKLTPAQEAARRKLAQEVIDKRLSAKGAIIDGKYISVSAAEAQEIVRKPNAFQRMIQGAGGLAQGALEKVKAIGGSIKDKVLGLITDKIKPLLEPILKPITKIAGRVFGTLEKLPGFKQISEFLKKQGINGLRDSAGIAKKVGAKGLPIVGGLVNLAFAYERLASGDTVGAGLEALSGLLDLSALLGFAAGPGISLGLDAFLFARDFVPGIKNGENSLVQSLGLTGILKAANNMGSKLPNIGQLAEMVSGGKPQQPKPSSESTSPVAPSAPPPAAPSIDSSANIDSPSSPSFIPSQSSSPQPQIIYRKVKSKQQSQGAPLRSGSATNVPSISSSNPDNFYTLYSQINYNVVM